MTETRSRPFDLPPVWLAMAVAIAWVQAHRFSFGLSFGPIWADLLGGLLVGGGILLMALAIYEMRRQQTTFHPHHESARLVQSGIFSRTRNPIYLGDVMVLAGLILYWDAVLSLPLVPLFLWFLERRFVIPEENRLRRTFRMDFAKYCEKVRRWV
ncbi:protein-S-isoprenylcysteine O-methyltransferase Ste14 [Shimia isoporae]|uniref:Protein-S-isoprenylcysteine O-methyltransferase Ste14 n=1 Tax=Shimia isoporae TaxID=647720 RepID=A0A4R1NNS0_9RHOB|nr:isoprenylcysteine carboxylmethyltransferase family protein [Shimia isoporae]TCL10087.1 protein-S-isoprenylcysteine O-methyltransferase Ste14 [Shimia isoporae]